MQRWRIGRRWIPRQKTEGTRYCGPRSRPSRHMIRLVPSETLTLRSIRCRGLLWVCSWAAYWALWAAPLPPAYLAPERWMVGLSLKRANRYVLTPRWIQRGKKFNVLSTSLFGPLRHQPLLVLGVSDPVFRNSRFDSLLLIRGFDVADQRGWAGVDAGETRTSRQARASSS
jgi:hypothetical protein